MPAKYSTYLEEAGINLSGGERQRIALARALIKEPDILILDEATSNLDFISEAKIYENLFSLNCTVIIIAHRLSTIRRCDKIAVVDENKIAELGTHAELIKKNGIYNKIYQSQVGEDIQKQRKTGKNTKTKKMLEYDTKPNDIDEITY